MSGKTKERPILFSAPMVRAILEGRKTQTRRAVKFPKWADQDGGVEFSGINDGPAMICLATGCFADSPCRYGAPGDRLWVRETWSEAKSCNCSDIFYRADGVTSGKQTALSFIEREDRWRPSIHMPRWASRINLEVTGVRVERLQDISQLDCAAEGMPESTNGFVHHVVADYRKLWSEINGTESWAANPWVWVVEFHRVAALSQAEQPK